jgi:ABC-type Fe3+/spermidine/putrescine transport system ATPase subunit
MIRVEGLSYRVGAFALRDLSLHVQPGEYFVLLGPSGAGKSVFLECLCGLNCIADGRVFIAGRDVTGLEPRHRGIGYLPQDYALFPHLSVRNNIRFGLRYQSEGREAIERRVDEVMELAGVAHLAGRRPQRLSGGEKQRVALARAAAIRSRVLLLDEPVSAVDEGARDRLCRQLKELHAAAQTTTLHVCHNFAEMLVVADRVAVIHQGQIVQAGTPQEVLQRPKNLLVARFVQAGNLFPARAESDGPWLRLVASGGMAMRVPRPSSACPCGEVTIMVRPENVHVFKVSPGSTPPQVPAETTTLGGSVRQTTDLGPVVQVRVACGQAMEVHVSLGKKEFKAAGIAAGDSVLLAVAPEDVHILEGE